jgi:hypothetical protein
MTKKILRREVALRGQAPDKYRDTPWREWGQHNHDFSQMAIASTRPLAIVAKVDRALRARLAVSEKSWVAIS